MCSFLWQSNESLVNATFLFAEDTHTYMRVHPYSLELMNGIYKRFGNRPFGMTETIQSVQGIDMAFFRKMCARGFIVHHTDREWKPVQQRERRNEHWVVPTYRLSEQILQKINHVH